MSKQSIRKRGGNGSRRTKSAPSLPRHSKSKSRSWSRSKADIVTKRDLNTKGNDTANVGKVYNYNGIRLKLSKAAVWDHSQFGDHELLTKAKWIIGGDLKIQLL